MKKIKINKLNMYVHDKAYNNKITILQNNNMNIKHLSSVML